VGVRVVNWSGEENRNNPEKRIKGNVKIMGRERGREITPNLKLYEISKTTLRQHDCWKYP